MGAAVAVVTVATVGQTVRPLSRISVLAPHRPDIGPQGFPVNTSATAAGVADKLSDPADGLVVTGSDDRRELSLADLAALPQTTIKLPITWLVGGRGDGSVTVESMQADSPYRTSVL